MPFKGIIVVVLTALVVALYCREDLEEVLSRWFEDEEE